MKPFDKWVVLSPAATLLATILIYDPKTPEFSSAKLPIMAAGTLASILFFFHWAGKKNHAYSPDRITLASTILFTWAALSLVWTPSVPAGVSDLSMFVCTAILAGLIRQVAQNHKASHPGSAFIVLVLSGTITTAGLILSVWAFRQNTPPNASIGNPNHLAAFIACSLPPAIWFIWTTVDLIPFLKSGETRFFEVAKLISKFLLSALYTVVVLKVIDITNCRSAYVALAAGLSLSLLVGSSSLKKRLIFLAPAAAAAAILLFVGWRYGENWSGRLQSRTYLSRLTYDMWKQRPIMGHGLGSFALRFPVVQAERLQNKPKERHFWTNAQKPHNEPLGFMAELGVGGIAVVVFFLALLVVIASGGGKETPGAKKSARGPPVEPDAENNEVRKSTINSEAIIPKGYRRAGFASVTTLFVTGLAEASFHTLPLIVTTAVVMGSLLPVYKSDSDRVFRKTQRARTTTMVFCLSALVGGLSVYVHTGQYHAERIFMAGRAERLPERSLELLQTAEAAAVKKGRIRFYLGLLLLETGRSEEALQKLQLSLQDFSNLGTHIALGNALMQLDRVEEAADVYRYATWLNPRFAAAHHNLAIALQRLGKHDEARKSRLRAHRIWPSVWPRHRKEESEDSSAPE